MARAKVKSFESFVYRLTAYQPEIVEVYSRRAPKTNLRQWDDGSESFVGNWRYSLAYTVLKAQARNDFIEHLFTVLETRGGVDLQKRNQRAIGALLVGEERVSTLQEALPNTLVLLELKGMRGTQPLDPTELHMQAAELGVTLPLPYMPERRFRGK